MFLIKHQHLEISYLNDIPLGPPIVWYPRPIPPLFGGNICRFASGTAPRNNGQKICHLDFITSTSMARKTFWIRAYCDV